MKHIKLFESIIGYQLVDLDEYSNKIVEDSVKFTEKELVDIKKTLNDNYDSLEIYYADDEVEDRQYLSVKSSKPIDGQNFRSYRSDIEIMKFDDEWYYLEIYNYAKKSFLYYKCDQFYGLINCIKNNIKE